MSRVAETPESRRLAVEMVAKIISHQRSSNLSRKEIAHRSGACLSAFYAWQQGDRLPSLPHLIAWADVFGTQDRGHTEMSNDF